MTQTLRALLYLGRLSWRTDRFRLLLGGGLLLLGTLCSPLVALVSRIFVESLGSPDRAVIVGLALGLVAALVGQLMLGHFAHLWYFELGERDEAALNHHLAGIVTDDLGLEEVDSPATADLLDRARMDIVRTRATVAAGLTLTASCAQLLMTAVLLSTVSPALLVLPFTAAVPVLLTNWAERPLREAQSGATPARRRLAHLHELVSSPASQKEIRLGGGAAHLARLHAGTHEEILRSMNRAHARVAVRRVIGQLPFTLTFAAAMAVVVWLSHRGAVGVGGVVLTLLLAPQVSQQVTALLQSLGTVGAAAQGLCELQELEAAVARRRSADRGGPGDESTAAAASGTGHAGTPHGAPDRADGRPDAMPAHARVPDRLADGIRLENLGYTYPGAAGPVLRGLDLAVPAGSSVAVVGENGAGKSTLVKLLHGLYPPGTGRILLDGADLADTRPREWFAATSALFQDFEHFDFRLGESIGIGDVPHVDDGDRIGAAVRRAGAESVVRRVGSLDGHVGRRYTDGTELSGGQWQSLAFARTLMKRRPLVLSLDEPAHSLDPVAEQRLQDAYEETARSYAHTSGAVTFYVTHRLSTVKSADFVLVLRDGRVEAFGPHNELLSAGGYYAELFRMQARAYA
ncbi:ATP-binding cassette domain-containing protein [Actinacidiphila acidipaludis]|uniref:ABC transporter ATP-binding protein/permease n=1 Tax=Actinacidiphila acidipaludis TaxID=2873382 RepID=A0ABS7QF29_9ACTN|nr:ABC transporter ATP-binding protein [Streptomyces acidipaludis]MBY8881446.1 ABC transporter ATP-binding protein/permease [Streptomyces acidipaludis]